MRQLLPRPSPPSTFLFEETGWTVAMHVGPTTRLPGSEIPAPYLLVCTPGQVLHLPEPQFHHFLNVIIIPLSLRLPW